MKKSKDQIENSKNINKKVKNLEPEDISLKAKKKTQESTKTSIKKLEAKTASKKSVSLDVRGKDGKVKGKVSVPAEIFDAKVNEKLMAQAVHIYLANQRQGNASTKTRAEVKGSTKKIYRQKGTGRARHGAITAPIFVGGGITHGPRPRDFDLSLPKKMKRAALFSALTSKTKDKKVIVVDGIIDGNGKTKEVKSVLTALELLNKRGKAEKRVLFVVPAANETARRAARNIENFTVEKPEAINTYEVLVNNVVLFAKDAIPTLESTFLKK